MKEKQAGISLKIFVLVSFIAMIIVNILAESLPISGITAGDVSDSYPNLFTPAGFTFKIWGVIYLFLAAYSLFQIGLFGGKEANRVLLSKTGRYFIISSLANLVWIFAWRYRIITLTVLLIVIMLICLIKISRLTAAKTLTFKEKLFIRLPFSIYFGWITVATVTNVTVLLVSLDWKGFGISPVGWTIAIIIIATLIGNVTLLKNKDAVYGLVFLWAYAGILTKHISENGFGGQYQAVISTIVACMVITAVNMLYSILTQKSAKAIKKKR